MVQERGRACLAGWFTFPARELIAASARHTARPEALSSCPLTVGAHELKPSASKRAVDVSADCQFSPPCPASRSSQHPNPSFDHALPADVPHLLRRNGSVLHHWLASSRLTASNLARVLTSSQSVVPGGQVSAAPLISFPTDKTTTAAPYTWIVDLAAGTAITLVVKDSTGAIAYSGTDTVGPNTECVLRLLCPLSEALAFIFGWA